MLLYVCRTYYEVPNDIGWRMLTESATVTTPLPVWPITLRPFFLLSRQKVAFIGCLLSCYLGCETARGLVGKRGGGIPLFSSERGVSAQFDSTALASLSPLMPLVRAMPRFTRSLWYWATLAILCRNGRKVFTRRRP